MFAYGIFLITLKYTFSSVSNISCLQQIKEITETSLSTNQVKSEMKRLNWKIEGGDENTSSPVRGDPVDSEALVVELGPMEIRTFLLKF